MKRISALLLSLLLALWSGGSFAAEKESKEFKLGILLPLTGTFAAVAETQKEGILLAVDEMNKAGGLSMPWGKVKVVTEVSDDEAKLDVGARRFRYIRDWGAHAVVGQTWAPLTFAINEQIKKEPIPYFPVCVMAKEAYEKGTPSISTFAAAYSPWTVGYMAGSAAINVLGKKKIFFLARSDSWGWGIEEGVKAAAAKYGATIVGRDEMPLGTKDFTTVLQKVAAAKPDVFIASQFGGDAIALLKQSYQLGLHNKMTIFNSFITNVVAKGLPPEALSELYAMHYFYWDMSGFKDKQVATFAKVYADSYKAKYGYPPDAYATIAYIAAKELFRAVEKAGSFDAVKVSDTVFANPDFMSVKGPAKWRKDHTPVYKYAGFLVKGKAKAKQTSEWDLFTVEGYQGGEDVMPTLESLKY
jgi:branched-chain amino acid transport system substrate-binding protein